MKFKHIMVLLATLVLGIVSYAANHRSASFISGTSVVFYQGATNTTTFAYDDSYATNVIYTNFTGTGVSPLATNSVSGQIYGSFESPVLAWANSQGDVSSPAISIKIKGNATLTNSIIFNFIRSADGLTYGTSTQDKFSFTLTPTTSYVTTITNVPATFLTGTKSIKWQNVVLGTNDVTTGILTVGGLSLNGYVP